MSLQKDLALCELPSHAEALDKALKAEWVRDQMNTDPRTGEKRRLQQNNLQDNKKGRWNQNQNQNQKQEKKGCERCGRNHEVKNCPWMTGACFQYGEKGHLIANCPKKTPQKQSQEGQRKKGEGSHQPPKAQGRLYNMNREDANNASDVVRGSEDNLLY